MSTEHSTIPTVNLLRSLANQNFTFAKAFGELIDNALDAGATEVTIRVQRTRRGTRFVTIIDNGNGTADPGVFVQPGGRAQHSTTQLGEYGIGAKDAAFWLCGDRHTIRVRSAHKGLERTLNYRWADVAEHRVWVPAVVSDPTPALSVGTQILLEPLVRDLPTGKALQALADRLGYLFSPALNRDKGGATIRLIVDDVEIPIASYELPEFDGDVVSEMVTMDGRSIFVKCGLVKEGAPNPHQGLTYFFRHRTIHDGPDGCGTYSTGRVAGVVKLLDGWTLTKNKDQVSRHSAKLYAAVLETIRPVLERASRIHKTAADAAFDRDIEDLLNSVVFGRGEEGEKDSRAKRGKGSKRGAVEPKNTGRRHRRADVIQPGTTFASRAFSRLRIEYAMLGPDSLGRFDPNGTVTMNTGHPEVAHLRSTSNKDALVVVACAIAAEADAGRAKLASAFGFEESSTPLQIQGEFLRRIRVKPANDTVEAAE